MAITVQRMSIPGLITVFVFYIVCHIGIALYKKKVDKDILSDKENEELQKHLKIVNFLYKWFPAIYLLGVLLMFYVN